MTREGKKRKQGRETAGTGGHDESILRMEVTYRENCQIVDLWDDPEIVETSCRKVWQISLDPRSDDDGSQETRLGLGRKNICYCERGRRRTRRESEEEGWWMESGEC